MAGFRKRAIIPADHIPGLTGMEWHQLSWQECDDPPGVIMRRINGWTTCEIHGFERLCIATNPIIQRGHRGRRLFVGLRSREAFEVTLEAPLDLRDPRIYELEYSLRDDGDTFPHPQLLWDPNTGTAFRPGKGGRGGRRN